MDLFSIFLLNISSHTLCIVDVLLSVICCNISLATQDKDTPLSVSMFSYQVATNDSYTVDMAHLGCNALSISGFTRRFSSEESGAKNQPEFCSLPFNHR